MSETENKQLEAMAKLEKLIEDNKLYGFDQEDVVALRRVITIIRGFDALGSFAGFIKSTLLYIGFIIGTIVAVRNGAIDFIVSIVEVKQ